MSSTLYGAGASIVINPEIGADVQGATVFKKAASIRDNLEANALYLRSEASGEALLFLNCDLAGITDVYTARYRQAIAAATDLPERSILIGSTHTHSGPSVVRTCYRKQLDTAYLDKLEAWLVTVSLQACEQAQPVRLRLASGTAQIGYNRRCCWADGTHTMHGNSAREDFTGLEGPDDPAHLAFSIENQDGTPLAVWHQNTTHTTCFYGRDFFSADFPGASRAYLREALHPDLAVLYYNGAFGDISIGNMLASHPHGRGGEQTMRRVAHQVTGETLRILHDAPLLENLTLRHLHDDLQVGVRLPDPERLTWAQDVFARMEAGEDIPAFDQLFAFGNLELHKEFADNPTDTLAIHAIRLGELLIATQPCELYCQFGLDIRRRSPAALTTLCGITDGYAGYCPTQYGVTGGGYSGEPIHWTRLAADAGYRIVDTTSRLARQLWA